MYVLDEEALLPLSLNFIVFVRCQGMGVSATGRISFTKNSTKMPKSKGAHPMGPGEVEEERSLARLCPDTSSW
jgi:hypothetical protein